MKTKSLLITLLALCLVSCNGYFSDMNVRNEYEPDIEAVMGDVNQYPSLIGGAYTKLWGYMLASGPGTFGLGTHADQYTASASNWNLMSWLYRANYEKPEINNTRAAASFPKALWYDYYGVISTLTNMLRTMKNSETPMIYKESGNDATYKILANNYFLLGMAYTEMALLFDKCLLITEETDIQNVTADDFKEAKVIQETALDYLNKCIEICQQHPGFDNFGGLFPQNAVVNGDKLERMANFMAARALAYFPRTNTESVDWNRVLTYTNKSLDQNIFAHMPDDSNFDVWAIVIAGHRNKQWVRVNMRIIKMMAPDDPNVKWPMPGNWSYSKNGDIPEVTTPDARIKKYFIYTTNPAAGNGGSFGYGLNYSPYVLSEKYNASANPDGVGDIYLFMESEADLLRAEALANTGGLSEAAALVNKTRVTNGGLHDITASSSKDEIIRAIYYERFVESDFAYHITPFYDRRRTPVDEFQITTHSFRQIPVPKVEIDFYGLDDYSFGGPDDANPKYKF